MFRKSVCLLPVIAACLLARPAQAAFIFTDSNSFLGALYPGSYTNTFDGPFIASPATFSANGFSYTISATNGLYYSESPSDPSGTFIGVAVSTDFFKITINGGNVSAIGANFFNTDLSDNFVSTTVTVNLSDGTSDTFTPTSLANSFRGYAAVDGVFITSLTVQSPGNGDYFSMDNLTVGDQTISTSAPPTALLGLIGLPLLSVKLASRQLPR